MYFDETLVMDYYMELARDFSNLEGTIFDIEEEFEEIVRSKNWESLTRDMFLDELVSLQDEVDKVCNIFMNVNNYIEEVISNYQTLNTALDNTVNDSFSNI